MSNVKVRLITRTRQHELMCFRPQRMQCVLTTSADDGLDTW